MSKLLYLDIKIKRNNANRLWLPSLFGLIKSSKGGIVKSIRNIVGDRIRELRKQRGLSQEGLGDKAGLHYTYIGAVERGEKNCSIETVEKIAKALKIEIGELFPKVPERTAKDMKALAGKHMDKLSSEILRPLTDLIIGIEGLESQKKK
jgi:transcriptional regulator with XRE-family HTH domain